MIHLLFSSLAVLTTLLLMISIHVSSTPVELRMEYEDGRSFLHPEERVTLSIQSLDNISQITITGPSNFTIKDWSVQENRFISNFLAPPLEGKYTLTVHGFQEGKPKSDSIRFTVESFELFIHPEHDHLVANGTNTEQTEVNLELVDWKGDPKEGELAIIISRISRLEDDGEPESQVIESFPVYVNGVGSFTFTPPPVNRTILYRLNASYLNYQSSECGIVVDPFILSLSSERKIMESGGSSIIGPYLKREEINIEVISSGRIIDVELSDLINEEAVVFNEGNNSVTFTPQEASIYQMTVTAASDGLTARAGIIISVNDWPVKLQAPGSNLIGEDLNVKIHRDNGAFFAVRALLFNEFVLPVSTISDLIEKGASSSPFFEKALLNGEGDGDLIFRTRTNLREGEYTIIVVLGSWEEEIDYHGIAFARVNFQRLIVDAPGEARIDDPISLTVFEEMDGILVPVNATIKGDEWSWILQHEIVTSFDSPGVKEFILTKSGNDVTSLRIHIVNHSIRLESPGHALVGQEFSILITNESGSPIALTLLEVQVKLDGSIVETSMVDESGNSYPVNLSRAGLYDLIFSMSDHTPASVTIQLIEEIDVVLPEKLKAGSLLTVHLQDQEGNPIRGLKIIIDDDLVIHVPDGDFSHRFGSGYHSVKVFSGDLLLHELTIHVKKDSRSNAGPECMLVAISASLIIIFLHLKFLSDRGQRKT